MWRRIPLQASAEPTPRYRRSRPVRQQSERKRLKKEESLEFDSSSPHVTDQVTKMNKEAGRQSVEEGPGRLVKNGQYVLS